MRISDRDVQALSLEAERRSKPLAETARSILREALGVPEEAPKKNWRRAR